MTDTALRYAIVQHSGYGYSGDVTFERGLESRRVATEEEQQAVEKAGGLLFGTYLEAEDFCEKAMYPRGAGGLIPAARGTFAALTVDGLAVYVPVRETTAVG